MLVALPEVGHRELEPPADKDRPVVLVGHGEGMFERRGVLHGIEEPDEIVVAFFGIVLGPQDDHHFAVLSLRRPPQPVAVVGAGRFRQAVFPAEEIDRSSLSVVPDVDHALRFVLGAQLFVDPGVQGGHFLPAEHIRIVLGQGADRVPLFGHVLHVEGLEISLGRVHGKDRQGDRTGHQAENHDQARQDRREGAGRFLRTKRFPEQGPPRE